MFNEFKAFISRGNVVDLAVGIILGSAFLAIVNSLVTDIIMPPIGLMLGGVDFSDLFITLSGGEYDSLAQATEAGAATLNIGVFINTVINFVIVAFAVFILVKQVNRLYRREAEQPSAPPAPPREEVLLEEIRDLLAQQRRG
ncbi:large conductance mechanosensitive channel protein MscL [Aquibaculum sediminis]|uniref:large conductance mechanosensitive channel protein MscL n=1 Tax=Aquibaculum sediminis TaxID=3231907 RepID=UPI003456B9F9